MDTNGIKREELLNAVAGFRMPEYAEITDVGLYLEQTVRLINSYLSALPGLEITGPMISNYVKQGLVPNPVKKQYGAEHIAILLFIAVSKAVLSIGDIKFLLDIKNRAYTTREAYDFFCREFKSAIGRIFDGGEFAITTVYDERSILRNMTVVLAHKIYLDAYFELVRAAEKPAAEG